MAKRLLPVTRLTLILPLAGLIAASLIAGFWLYPAYRFLRSYFTRLSSQTLPNHPVEQKIGELTVHLYKPEAHDGSVLILVAGLHPNGIYDSRFIAFAENCRDAGFYAVAPDLKDYREFRITERPVHQIRNLMDHLHELIPAEAPKNIGMLGISYGVGPVFAIAAEKKLDYIVSIGGYYNLLHAIEYSFTGTHPGGEARGAHEWGRLIFALNFLEQLADKKDAEILRSSLILRLQLKVEEATKVESDLSDQARDLLNGILNGLSPSQIDSFRRALNTRQTEARNLSIESVLNKIPAKTHIYLLHGTTDSSIPFEETLELDEAFRKAGRDPATLITEGLTHVDVIQGSTLWEGLKLMHWARLLLREARRG